MLTTGAFDLDDTLYDEIEYCKSGFRAVAEFLANSSGAPPAELGLPEDLPVLFVPGLPQGEIGGGLFLVFVGIDAGTGP